MECASSGLCSLKAIADREIGRASVGGKVYCPIMNRITIDPEQCGGRACIRGMRIRVVDVLDLLGNGLTAQEVLEELPDLEPEDIRACLQYANRRNASMA